ncbi:tryptophan synthase subunit alpha [bacterium]
MNRIDKMFQNLNSKKEKGLFPFVTAGYPDLNTTEKIIYTLEKAGADLIEIGVPFSDPIADGPIIQKSSHMALQNGINIDKIFDMIKKIRQNTNIPIVLMSYYNPLLKLGKEYIVEKSLESGVDGFIIPDLLINESEDFNNFLSKHNLYQIFLASINTKLERLQRITKKTKGFLYLISKLGVTGPADLNVDIIKEKVDYIRSISNIPIAIGFGISNKNQVNQIKNLGDAVIVGSALIKIIGSNKNNIDDASNFIHELKNALK